MDIEKIKEVVIEKYKGQTRKQGTPYYLHPFAVANMLKENGFNEKYQIVGFCHDLLEDTDISKEELIELTNDEILKAVILLTKTDGYSNKKYIEEISKNHMAKMVKLADRIHNLSEINFTSKEFKQRYLKEVEEFYVKLSENTIFEEKMKDALNNLKNNI